MADGRTEKIGPITNRYARSELKSRISFVHEARK